ncbi:MAG TPA: DUF1801 domain-containing protein [Candidatus Limnocylindrales bacterium]|nr:DUF1801 domain-containing protein [Candidatus Limnocylindrales bacterium]
MSDDEDAIERFLLDFPEGIRHQAHVLRSLVRRTRPASIERIRPGWRLIGYDLPVGKRGRYFAYIAPELEHVHLGFEYGTLMSDPDELLHGAHLGLKKVRYLTYLPGDAIPSQAVLRLVNEGAEIAAMTTSERVARLHERRLT